MEEPTSLNLSWNVTTCGPSDNFNIGNYLFKLLPWDMTAYILVEIYQLFGDVDIPNFYSEDTGSRYLRKVTRFLPDYTALHRRRWNFACTLLTFCVLESTQPVRVYLSLLHSEVDFNIEPN